MKVAYNIKKLITLTVLILSATYATSGHTEETTNQSKRIISAGGSITEVLFALGIGDQLVAVDSSSLYPEQATSLPKVGYFRDMSAEGLMSLNPDTIIAAKGAGPKAVLEQIDSLGVNVKTYDQGIYTMSAWQTLVSSLGHDYGKSTQANNLIDETKENIEKALLTRNYIDEKINAITLLSIGQRGPVAAGQNTVPNFLLTLAGINNLANELDGYKPFSTEVLAQEKLDLILIPSHVIDGLGGRDTVCKNPVLQRTMTGKCNIYVMDGLLLMGFGSRIDQALESIIKQVNQR